MCRIFHSIVFVFLVLLSPIYAQPCEPEIVLVTVDPSTNDVIIYFEGCDEYDEYKIYQWKADGSIDLVTGEIYYYQSIQAGISADGAGIHSTSFYLEDIEDNPVGFGVEGISDDPLGNSDISSPPISTIHLSGEPVPCSATLNMQWTEYTPWSGSIEYYEITARMLPSLEIIQTIRLDGVTQEYPLQNLPVNNTYLVYVTAKAANLTTNNFSTSNGIEYSTYHARHPEFIYANYGTLNSDNAPELLFSIDPYSELDTYQLSRSTSPTGSFNLIETLTSTSNTISYTDTEVDASAQAYYYRLTAFNTIDNCNTLSTASDNLAQTIQLTASNTNYTVNLNYTDYQNWPGGVDEYIIERSINNSTYHEIYSGTESIYQDTQLEELAGTGVNNEVCYRITAYENDNNSHNYELATSTSNIACVTLPVNIELYNAFIPGNPDYDGFEPKFDFLPVYYDFKIFNRTGSVVYHSKDVRNTRWDGRSKNGNYVPQGVYRYTLIYNDENNVRQVLKGSLTVIRQ